MNNSSLLGFMLKKLYSFFRIVLDFIPYLPSVCLTKKVVLFIKHKTNFFLLKCGRNVSEHLINFYLRRTNSNLLLGTPIPMIMFCNQNISVTMHF